MTIKYLPSEFEKKWVEEWDKNKTYKALKPDNKHKKQFIFPMFPYPSGAGLHVGHVRVYTGTDVIARFYRMNQYAVLHPIGWDAFGLPAENAAIKAKKNPMDMVPDHIATFKRQMKSLGFSFDWDREFATTDPSYYKWTQWLFLQFYKMGLLYKKNAPINFCPFCKTGLSEEEVLPNGTHERCGNKIEKKDLPQWLFKITKYADRLLTDLKGLDWPRGILEMQKNWIGKKEGVVISHNVKDLNIKLETFSAFPAWLFADTFIVVAPEHPIVRKLVDGTKYEKEANLFIKESKKISVQERTEDKFEKKGVFTGRYAEDPFNKGRLMPIWLANFALLDFGTGIIRCSAHDVRDYIFAQKYKIHLEEVVKRVNPREPINAHDNSGILINSGEFTGRYINEKLIEDIKNWIVKTKIGRKEQTYHLRDWIFSRQRYWGEPIPIIICKKCGLIPVPEDQLPVELPKVKSYEATGTGESPLSLISNWVNVKCPRCEGPAKRETDTMPNWAGSCWYFLRFADPKNNKEAWSQEAIGEWMPTDWYIGGAEHAVLHLLYARFWVKALYDLKLLNFKEPFTRLRNLGMILAEDHRKMSKSLGNVVNPDDVQKEYGADALRIYEMFMAPFDQEISWATKSLQGSYRFVKRIWDLYQIFVGDEFIRPVHESKQLVVKLQKAIKKVTSDIPDVKFNTSIAVMMEFINEWENKTLSKENAKKFLQILAPFAPFLTEEIWHEVFGEKTSIHLSTWPKVEGEIVEEEIILPVQVNGKLRATIKLSNNNLSETAVVNRSLKEERVKKYIEGKEYKIIYVSGKIINFIVK
ncbi:leucine--tRNA ligase [Candidatus Roizmanbacteria bacterium]|nr:leucine--tRNA ligase [Candidatus Roizmanbacteria bacterium]